MTGGHHNIAVGTTLTSRDVGYWSAFWV